MVIIEPNIDWSSFSLNKDYCYSGSVCGHCRLTQYKEYTNTCIKRLGPPETTLHVDYLNSKVVRRNPYSCADI